VFHPKDVTRQGQLRKQMIRIQMLG
jgi:hypothetical protein